MTTVTERRPPLASSDHLDDELEALIEEARRRARRRRLLLAGAVLCAVVIGAGLFATIAFTGVTGRTSPGAPDAPGLLANGRPIAFRPYSFGYVKEGFLRASKPRDRVLIARTRKQGLLWDRWLTHRRASPPGAAYFPGETLLGVFLLGHPSSTAQAAVITKVVVSGTTVALALRVSRFPLERCGSDPVSGAVCRPMYKPPSLRYHAMAIITVPRKTLKGIRRVVVKREVRDTNEIEVNYPG